MPTPDADLVALRDAIAREIADAKLAFPPKHHAVLDMIGSTLDQIGADMVPDFARLDQQTRGGVTAMIRADMRSIAEDGIVRDTADAGSYVEELAPFVDKLRLGLTEWLARQNRRTLERLPIHDA